METENDGAPAPIKKPRKPHKPYRPRGHEEQRGKSPALMKIGYSGWVINRVPSKQAMRIFVAPFSRPHLKDKPQTVYWPVLDDWDGAKRVIDAMMNNELELMNEFKLRFPEHEFGFEKMLEGHATDEEVVERRVLKSIPLQRDHVLNIELVKLVNENIQVHAVLRRGPKALGSEVYYDQFKEDAGESGTDDATYSATEPD